MSLVATIVTIGLYLAWSRAQGRGERPEIIEMRDREADAKFKERVARERIWVEEGMPQGGGRSVTGNYKDETFDLRHFPDQLLGDQEKTKQRRKRSRSQRRGDNNV